MLTVPVTLRRLIVKFAPRFSKRVWEHVQILVVGALLASSQRMVTAVLRVMGLSQERHFQNYHRVLNRARWSSLATARVLLELVVRSFAPHRRGGDWARRHAGTAAWGEDQGQGIYRDPVRSSRSHMVKASGVTGVVESVPFFQAGGHI
jgi:DDE superfamily endonuclease